MADEKLDQPAADTTTAATSTEVEAAYNVEAPVPPPEQAPAGQPPEQAPAEAPRAEAQPTETPQPGQQVQTEEAAPAGAVREDSVGVDREPLKGEEAMRPTRDPSVPAPKSRKLKVGDEYVVNYPRKAPMAMAVIKVLTNEPGRHVGVEFEQPVGQYADNGNCNGKCRVGHGLWVHPSHLITEEEQKAMVAQGEAEPGRISQEVEELEFDAETG